MNAALSLITMLILSACAAVPLTTPVTIEEIEVLIADQEFAKATTLLQSVTDSHPDFEALQAISTQLTVKQASYQQSRIKAATTLMSHYQWDDAAEVLRLAIERAGESPELTAMQATLNQEKDSYKLRLQSQIHLDRSAGLKQEAASLEQLARFEPSQTNKRNLSRKRKELANTAEQLKLCGDHEVSEKNFDRARECYQASLSLQHSQDVANALLKLPVPATKLPPRIPVAKVDAAKAAFIAARADNNWQEASRQILQLTDMLPEDEVIRRMSEQFGEEKKAYINQQILIGQRQYTEGEVKQALATWTAVKPIAGSHQELDNRITRAKRFVANLEKLESNN